MAIPVRARRLGAELVLASFLALFLELALIRWLPAQVRVLAYFPNLILLSAFLGLGVGCLRANRPSLLWTWPVALLLLMGSALAGSRIAFTQQSTSEHLWLLYADLPPGAPVVPDVRLPILAGFVLSALVFVPLGQLVGRRIQEYAGLTGSSLQGYALDICGSLLGVAAFWAMSFTGAFPVVWFSVVVVAAGWFFRAQPRSRWLYLAVAVLVPYLVATNERAQYYSPYYALNTAGTLDGEGAAVLANGSFHQIALRLDLKSPPNNSFHKLIRENFHTPYRMLPQVPQRGLVVGAGSGNDVAVMLDENVAQVDAVEIDPVILQIGRWFHPNKPYEDPRVRLINTDARQYLSTTGARYDVIVFGTLDSMTRLSALSNVRLDNFMYTRECLQAARRCLTDRGVLAVYYAVVTPYIHERFLTMLTEVFGEPPVVVKIDPASRTPFTTIYLAGPGVSAQERTPQASPAADVPTDDWPYLYLSQRGISSFYLTIIACLGVFSAVAVVVAWPELRQQRPDWVMFWLGLSFLLQETRSVTEMNLVWGVTWMTNAVVFACILVMVLASTLLAAVRPLPLSLSFGALFTCLGASYLVPTSALLVDNLALKLILSLSLVGLPIFFAGTCFAVLFARREHPERAFGWNLLGAAAGGLTEFLTMAIGLKALLLVALTAYVLAFWLARREAV